MPAVHRGCQYGRAGPPASLGSGVEQQMSRKKNAMFSVLGIGLTETVRLYPGAYRTRGDADRSTDGL